MAFITSGIAGFSLVFLLLLAFVVVTAVVLAVKSPEVAAALAVGLGAFLVLLAMAQAQGGKIKLVIFVFVFMLGVMNMTVNAQGVVPLQWIDTGKEVLPGTYVEITVHSEGCVSCGGLADAGFMISNKKFGIAQDGRTVLLFFEGHPHEIDKLPWIKRKMYDAVFEVKLYCPGQAPPGEQPRDGFLWLEVYSPSHGVRHTYLIRDSSTIAPSVYWFAESNSVIKGSVNVGEVERFQKCSGYSGDQLSSGDGAGDNFLGLPWSKIKIALIVFVILLVAPLILSFMQASIGLYKTIRG